MVELFRSPRRLLVLLFECLLVGLLYIGATCLRAGFHDGLTTPNLGIKATLIALVFGGSFYYSGLYDFGSTGSTRVVFERVLKSLPFAGISLLVAFYFVPMLEVGRGIFLATLALAAVVVPSWRYLYNRVTEASGFTRRTL